jgi:hypothetical protein
MYKYVQVSANHDFKSETHQRQKEIFACVILDLWEEASVIRTDMSATVRTDSVIKGAKCV